MNKDEFIQRITDLDYNEINKLIEEKGKKIKLYKPFIIVDYK